MELRTKAIKATFWSTSEQVLESIVLLFAGLAMARILDPEDFGVFGLLTVFIMVTQILIDGGFSSALIQKKNIKQIDINSVFYFNIIIGMLSGIVLFLASSAISLFYDHLILKDLIRVLSFALLIDAFGATHNAVLRKRLDFKRLFIIHFSSRLLSSIIGILMALNGEGIWSLLALHFTYKAINTGGYWLFSKIKIETQFSLPSLKSLWGYGGKMMASNLIMVFSDNINLIIMGKVFAKKTLGFYTESKRIKNMPLTIITSGIGKVAFSVFSKIQDERQRFSKVVKTTLVLNAFFVFPVMAILFLFAESLVFTVLTIKWIHMVPILKIMCIGGFLYPLHAVNVNAITAKGRSDINVRIGIIKNILRLTNVLSLYKFGIITVLYGEVIVSIIALMINTHYSRKLFQLSLLEQMKSVLPYAAMIATTVICILFVQTLLNIQHQFLSTILLSTVGLALYICFNMFFKTKAFTTIKEASSVLNIK